MRSSLSRLTNRLSFRQARLAAGVAVVLGACSALFQINADLSDEKRRIAKVGEQALRPVLGSMSRAAYRLDQEVAAELASGILTEPSILEVRIVDDFEDVLSKAVKPRPTEELSVFSFLINSTPIVTRMDLTVEPEDLHVGHVEVTVDPVVAAQSFFRRTALILFAGLASTFALTVALTFLFYWIVTRRVERMAAPFRAASDAAPPESQGDELDSLDRAIRSWREQREQAAEKIAVAAKRMEMAAQVARLGVWEWDLKDGSVQWDDGMHDLYGIDRARDDISFDTWTSLLHPDDREHSLHVVNEALEGDGAFNHVFRIVREDGKVATLHGVGKTEYDEAGHAAKMVGVNIDVSEEEKLRIELETMQRVEALGALSAGVAHDFNNVLAVIMGNLELAIDEEAKTARNHVSIALHACQQGKALTMQLLAFGRKSQLRPKPTDLNDTVEKLIPMLTRTIPSSIEITASLAPELRCIRVDRALLETSILNLVINARDAMTDGGRVSFETSEIGADAVMAETQAKGLPAARYVRLAVEDTGSGIAPEHLSRIFDPFFSTKKFGKGHGMGLSMVRGFVEQSGGIVRIRSEKGEGTSVRLYFPASETGAAAGDDAARPAMTAPLDRKTILVVEDSPEVRRMTVLQLKHLGHSTIEAGNAQDGMSVLASGVEVDLVLTDAIMPGELQGFDLARQLSERDDAPPVILMSGYDGGSLIGTTTDVARFEFLPKPASMHDLEMALSRAFGKVAAEAARD